MDGPKEPLCDRGPDRPRVRRILGGHSPYSKTLGVFAVVYAKTAEPFDVVLDRTRVGSRNHLLDVVKFGKIYLPLWRR